MHVCLINGEGGSRYYYSWRKKKSDDAQVESQTTKKQQTSLLYSRMYMPLWSNHRNFTTYRLNELFIRNCLGFRFHPFLYLTPLHTTMKTYTTTKRSSWGSRSAWKKGTGEPQDNRLVRMLPLCLVRWETTIASAQISQRERVWGNILCWLSKSCHLHTIKPAQNLGWWVISQFGPCEKYSCQ